MYRGYNIDDIFHVTVNYIFFPKKYIIYISYCDLPSLTQVNAEVDHEPALHVIVVSLVDET